MSQINFFDVLENLSNPENCDIMHVYLITNFKPDKEMLIKQQAVNHLKLKHLVWVQGMILNNNATTVVQSKDPTQKEHKIGFKSTKTFVTNQFIEPLYKMKDKAFAVSFNEVWNSTNNVELFYINNFDFQTSELLKAEMLKENVDQDSFPKNQSLTHIEAVTFDSLVSLSDTIITFNQSPGIEEIDKINWFQYMLPANAVYQTLSVFGDMYNSYTGETLKNVLLPLQIARNNAKLKNKLKFLKKEDANFETQFSDIQALPILTNLNNISEPSQLNIKNFNLDYQLPWVIVKEAIKNENSLENVFQKLIDTNSLKDDGTNFNDKDKIELIRLFKKMYVITFMYQSNFDAWKEKLLPDKKMWQVILMFLMPLLQIKLHDILILN